MEVKTIKDEMNNFLKKPEENEDGFTLIEILVVILIIGILASIAVPLFMNQRKKSIDASTMSDVKNAGLAMQTYFTSNPQAEYAPVEEIRKIFTKTPGTVVIIMGTKDDYCAYGYNVSGKKYPGGAWTSEGQPYVTYVSNEGGLGTVTTGISAHSCYQVNRFYL